MEVVCDKKKKKVERQVCLFVYKTISCVFVIKMSCFRLNNPFKCRNRHTLQINRAPKLPELCYERHGLLMNLVINITQSNFEMK